jgi:hypothetical protein
MLIYQLRAFFDEKSDIVISEFRDALHTTGVARVGSLSAAGVPLVGR